MKRIPSLDGFRAISIILVIIAHCRLSNGFPKGFVNLAVHGAVGVTVFFLISGFLITTLLLQEKKDKGKIDVCDFYIRRAFRILPVFLLYTLFIVVWNYFDNLGVSYNDLLHAITFTVNFDQSRNWFVGHFWTLSVEEQFYFFWPALLLAFHKHIKTLVLLLISYSSVSRIIAYKFPAYSSIFLTDFFNHSDAIFIGVLGAIFNFENPKLINKVAFKSYSLQLIALALMCLFVYCSYHNKFSYISLPFGNIIISLCTLFLVLSYIKPGSSWVFRLLNSKLMIHIGILSYSIYIWQEFFVVGPHAWKSFPANVLLIYIVALISYYLWERPFLSFKKALFNNTITNG